MPHIICIAYAWYGDDEITVLNWGNSIDHERNMIAEFDKIIEQADIVIGKNSDRFDNKHLNSQRLLLGLPGKSEWTRHTDDLEKHLRKHFWFPSYKLDYFDKVTGGGGKVSTSFDMWVDINWKRIMDLAGNNQHTRKVVELLSGIPGDVMYESGECALEDMVYYNAKDVADTARMLQTLLPHIELKYNANVVHNADDRPRCRHCGGLNVIVARTKPQGKTLYREFKCKDCNKYAGRAPVAKSGKLGRIG